MGKNLTDRFPDQSAAIKAACNITSVPKPAVTFDQVTACANFVMETLNSTLLATKTI